MKLLTDEENNTVGIKEFLEQLYSHYDLAKPEEFKEAMIYTEWFLSKACIAVTKELREDHAKVLRMKQETIYSQQKTIIERDAAARSAGVVEGEEK